MGYKIKIASVINDSIVDGPGIRMTVFFQGCSHGCEGCFNKETWDFNGGHYCDVEDIYKAAMNNPLLDGITLSGGDPIYQVKGALELVKSVALRGVRVAGGVWHPGGAFPFRPLKIGIFFGNLFVSAAFFLLLSLFGICWRMFARFFAGFGRVGWGR